MIKTKTIRGTSGDNRLRGTAAIERILGLGGDDRLLGLGGDDLLFGGSGEDRLEGGDGNDRLDGGAGEDVLAGGKGDDFYVFTKGDRIGGEAKRGGTDTVQSSLSLFLPTNFENLILTGNKAINGAGNDGKNQLTGNNAANLLSGGKGNDVLIGNGGNDQLDGGVGRDLLDGGIGNDSYAVDNAGDRVREAAGQGDDTIFAAVNFSLATTPNVENLTLVGSAFDGVGNDLDNKLTGNSGTNTLSGGGGDDELDGQGGGDSLNGGDGDDRLLGGTGNDVLVGGAGLDEFVFDANTPFTSTTTIGQDVIGDFAVGFDTIVLDKDTFTALRSGSGRGFSVASDFAVVATDREVTASRAIIVYSEQTDRLYYHPGGAGTGAALFAILNGSPNLSASDFAIES